MKKILFILLAFISLTTNAQKFEPEFIGEVNLTTDGNIKLLDKSKIVTKTSADASILFTGIGSIRSKFYVQGKQASVRIKRGIPFSLIVNAGDNSIDPFSVITVFRFDVKNGKRRAELSNIGVWSSSSDNNLKMVQFQAKKFGSHSYSISFSNLLPGEYGVIVNKIPSTVMCFGVDGELTKSEKKYQHDSRLSDKDPVYIFSSDN